MRWNFQYLFSSTSVYVNSIEFNPKICRDLRVFLGVKLVLKFLLCVKNLTFRNSAQMRGKLTAIGQTVISGDKCVIMPFNIIL